MKPEELRQILAYAGIFIPSGLFFGIFLTLYAIKHWAKIKLFFVDIFWRGPHTIVKAGRKFNVKWEIEGNINSFIKNYNSELVYNMLPECQVIWVTESNHNNVVQEGKAIIRVSYNSENHDLNLYNAAYSFVQTSLLHHAKPFMNPLTCRALDLLLTKELVKLNRRIALTIFNNKFREEGEDCKQVYYQLDEIEQRGLFKRLLLQEIYFFGENIGGKTPKKEYEIEADKFVDWVYELATREHGEKTDLAFQSENIKAGVILVASEETFSKFGKAPYVLRANKYSSDGYPIIYILARGDEKVRVAFEVAKELVKTSCFSFLTKKNCFKVFYNNIQQLVACIPLKIELTTIIEQAWEKIGEKYRKKEQIKVLVEQVSKDDLIVNAYGLKIIIAKENLSNLGLLYLYKYFEPNMELEVYILEFDQKQELIILSNKGTATDPEQFVSKTKDLISIELAAIIERIVLKDNFEIGIYVKFEGVEGTGFIPRNKATYSRFIALSEKYKIGQKVKVKPINFNINYATLVCDILEVIDPWQDIQRYKEHNRVQGIVREIQEKYITCEIAEGIEGRLSSREISWDLNSDFVALINQYKIGDLIDLLVIDIDIRRRILIVSKKRLTEDPLELFFKENPICEGEIISVDPQKAMISLSKGKFLGYLPKREVMWLFCEDIQKTIKVKDVLKVKPLSIDQRYNNIIVSAKRVEINKYNELKSNVALGDIGKARVVGYYEDCVRLKMFYDGEYSVESYVHKSEISSFLYIETKDLASFFMKGEVYSFMIKRFIEKLEIVELSRKGFLKNNLKHLLEGKEYRVNIAGIVDKNIYIYCDEFEGKLERNKVKSIVDKTLNVAIIKKIEKEGWVLVNSK